jgi:pimeloyl-ACP methyl ester carboxylesterase
MSSNCKKILVAAETDDGQELHGVLIQTEESLAKPVFVWIHGFGANFYFAPYLRLGEGLADQGYSFLIGNTRGHDFGTLLESKGRAPYLGGAAWERLEESGHDLAAWIEFAVERGFDGIVLAGHSIGAVKITAYQARQPNPHVRGLVLASPPLRPSWDTQAYPSALAQARRLAAEGRPEELFAGPWGPVSAQTYLSLDRFGFDHFGRETASPSLGLIHCPVLVLIGTKEEQVVAPDDLEVVRRNAVAAARLETHVIDGADHFYAGHEQDVAIVLAHWANCLQGH